MVKLLIPSFSRVQKCEADDSETPTAGLEASNGHLPLPKKLKEDSSSTNENHDGTSSGSEEGLRRATRNVVRNVVKNKVEIEVH